MEEMEFENIPSKRHITAIDSKNPDMLSLPNNPEVKKLSIWIIVRRYIGAFFLYLIYWLTLFGALKQVVGATLSPKEASELVDEGFINSIWDYGWGEHYIWFLISICVVTFCCGGISGATAKKKGGIVATIANMPILVLIILMCYLHYRGSTFFKSVIPWIAVLPLSAIGSSFMAFLGGRKGEQLQNSLFRSNTILGIRPVHWWWLIFPLHFIILELIPKVGATLRFILAAPLIRETKYSVVLFIMFVAFATFIYFVIWGWFKTFQLLSLEHKTNLGKCGIVLSILFYLWGIPILFDVFCVFTHILFKRFFSL